MLTDKHPLMIAAIKAAGSQAELGRRTGYAQQHISKLLNREIAVGAEMAVAIEKATDGRVSRWKLRPDLWDVPADARTQTQSVPACAAQ